jgi:anti-sigma factor RsiW
MLDGHQGREIHERFRELNALANSGALTPLERSELNAHLDSCEECREAALEYRILAAEGIPAIAAAYTDRPAQ